jgi:hypothetical protein
MKPYIVYAALALAILFLGGAALACAELLQEGNLLTSPKVKPALGLLVSGSMFLAIGLRGWHGRRRQILSGNQQSTGQRRT